LTKDIAALLDAASAADWLGPKEAPVILKPNLVISSPASGGATTTPEIAEGLIVWLLDNDFKRIVIAEGSWVGDSTAQAFKVCGYSSLATRYNIPLIDLQQDSSVTMETDDGPFKVCETIAELEYSGGSLINLPLLKGHGQTLLTCALKNLKGCIPDSEKRRYHRLGVHDPVAMVNTLIKPAFALVDGLNPDPYWEEGGSPMKRDLLFLARDPVAMDSYAAGILGLTDAEVPYIGRAESLGVGSAGTRDEDIISLDNTTWSVQVPDDSGQSEIRQWINSLVDQQSACSSCFGNLASALRLLQKENPELINKKAPRICIGQEFRGSRLPEGSPGIGICTLNGNNNALKGCPPSREDMIGFLKQTF